MISDGVHRCQQLQVAVETRYLASVEECMERHQALADYFAAQPWRLGPLQWNWRKLQELVPQYEQAGNSVDAKEWFSFRVATTGAPVESL